MQTHRAGRRQEPQLAGAARTHPELLNHTHPGCAGPQPPEPPKPPKQVGEHPRGWTELALPLHPRDSAEGLPGAGRGAEHIQPPLSSFLEIGTGCTAASNFVRGWRSETRARTTRSSSPVSPYPQLPKFGGAIPPR